MELHIAISPLQVSYMLEPEARSIGEIEHAFDDAFGYDIAQAAYDRPNPVLTVLDLGKLLDLRRQLPALILEDQREAVSRIRTAMAETAITSLMGAFHDHGARLSRARAQSEAVAKDDLALMFYMAHDTFGTDGPTSVIDIDLDPALWAKFRADDGKGAIRAYLDGLLA